MRLEEKLCFAKKKNCLRSHANMILHIRIPLGTLFEFHLEYRKFGNFPWYIYLNINQLDALNFIMSLFPASSCFEHKCSSSGGQNCTIQSLVSSHWNKWVIIYLVIYLVILVILLILNHSLVSVWWYQRLYSTILASWRWALVLETCRGRK